MLKLIKSLLAFILLLCPFILSAQKHYDAIYSGIPWFDNQGNIVSAHGACIVKDNGRYYLFGERHTDTSKAFAGFTCYSSRDLQNWKFDRLALPVQHRGSRLGPDRIGERVKVMKCPETGEYVMYMHTDDLEYRDPCICYATSQSITGPYEFQGPLLFNGYPIEKWDMGTFQDYDGSGYLLIHGGAIYKLGSDYKSISEQVSQHIASGFESPAIFRKDSIYYFLGSHLTSWERNDNYYYTAPSLQGPWKSRGLFAPKGTLTWNSQTTFVLSIEGSKDTTYMYMGDRWSFPRQASAATYVWQPLTVSGTSLSISDYHKAWKVSPMSGTASTVKISGRVIENTDTIRISYSNRWQQEKLGTISASNSDTKGAKFMVQFYGRQIGLYGFARPDGGYARVMLQDGKGNLILSSIIDMYCMYRVSRLKFLTPVLPKSNYTLTVTVMGGHGNWSDKSGRTYGSTGNFVSLDKIVIKK